jgi:hypothetical protein
MFYSYDAFLTFYIYDVFSYDAFPCRDSYEAFRLSRHGGAIHVVIAFKLL